jgi:hypothetical protein
MKNVALLFSAVLKNFEATMLVQIKTKNNFSVFIKTLLTFFVYNSIVFLPIFIISKSSFSLNMFILLNIIIFILLTVNTILKLTNFEKVNKIFYDTTPVKSDFFNLLQNDIIFNICFSILISTASFIYILIIYSITLISQSIKFPQFAILLIAFLLIISLSIFIFNIIYLLKKRDLKNTFFKLQNYKIFNSNIFSKNKIIKKIVKEKSETNKSTHNTNQYNNILFLLKLSYPVLIFIVLLILLLVFDKFLKLSLNLILFQSLIFPMFFVYPLLKSQNQFVKNNNRPFIFTVFIFSILFIINFFQPVATQQLFKKGSALIALKDFINPIFISYNNFINAKNSFFSNIFIIFVFFAPVLFLIVYNLNNKLLMLKNNFERFSDNKIVKKLGSHNSTLIFGDTISKYPFIFSLILNLILISILIIEKTAFSDFFFNLINTLQISSVFHFNFLTKENIFIFFNILFNILIAILIFRLFILLISSFFSHFMLFNDEIIYIENKTFFNTTLRIPITNINYIIIKQNILEKLLDIGTIFIETADKNGIIRINGISSIKEKNKIIMEKVKIGLQKIK